MKDEDAWRRDSRSSDRIFPLEMIPIKGKKDDAIVRGQGEYFNNHEPKHEKETHVAMHQDYRHQVFKNLGRHKFQENETPNRSEIPRILYKYPALDEDEYLDPKCKHAPPIKDLNVTAPKEEEQLSNPAAVKEDESIEEEFDWLTAKPNKTTIHVTGTIPSTTKKQLPVKYIFKQGDFKGHTPNSTKKTTKRKSKGKRLDDPDEGIWNEFEWLTESLESTKSAEDIIADLESTVEASYNWLSTTETNEILEATEPTWTKAETTESEAPLEEITSLLEQLTQVEKMQEELATQSEETKLTVAETELATRFTLEEITEDVDLKNNIQEALDYATEAQEAESKMQILGQEAATTEEPLTTAFVEEAVTHETTTQTPFTELGGPLKQAEEIQELEEHVKAEEQITFSNDIENGITTVESKIEESESTTSQTTSSPPEEIGAHINDMIEKINKEITSEPETKDTGLEKWETNTKEEATESTENSATPSTTENIDFALNQATEAQRLEEGINQEAETTTGTQSDSLGEAEGTSPKTTEETVSGLLTTEYQEKNVINAVQQATEGLEMEERLQTENITLTTLFTKIEADTATTITSSELTTEATEDWVEAVLHNATEAQEMEDALRTGKPSEEATEESITAEAVVSTEQSTSVTISSESFDSILQDATEAEQLLQNLASEITNIENLENEETKLEESTTESLLSTESSSTTVLDAFAQNAEQQAKESDYQAENFTPQELSSENSSNEKAETESFTEVGKTTNEDVTNKQPDELVQNAENVANGIEFNVENFTPEKIFTVESINANRTNASTQSEESSDTEETTEPADIQQAMKQAAENQYLDENITPEETSLETSSQEQIQITTETTSTQLEKGKLPSTEESDNLATVAVNAATQDDYLEENFTPEEFTKLEFTTKEEQKVSTETTEFELNQTDEFVKKAFQQATESQYQDENITPEGTSTLESATGLDKEELEKETSKEENEATTEIHDEFANNAVKEAAENEYLPENITPEESTIVKNTLETEIVTGSSLVTGEEMARKESSTTENPDELIESAVEQATNTEFNPENFTPEKTSAFSWEGNAQTEIATNTPESQLEEKLESTTVALEDAVEDALEEASKDQYEIENITPAEKEPHFTEKEIDELTTKITEETQKSTTEEVTPEELIKKAEEQANRTDNPLETITPELTTLMEESTETETEVAFSSAVFETSLSEETDILLKSAVEEATKSQNQPENITPEELSTLETEETIKSELTASEIEGSTSTEIIADDILKKAENEATATQYLPENVTPEETTLEETSKAAGGIVGALRQSTSETEETSNKEAISSEITEIIISNAMEQATEGQLLAENVTPEELPTAHGELEIQSDVSVSNEESTKEVSTTVTDELVENVENEAMKTYLPENFTPEEMSTKVITAEQDDSEGRVSTKIMSELEQIFGEENDSTDVIDEMMKEVEIEATRGQYELENSPAEKFSQHLSIYETTTEISSESSDEAEHTIITTEYSNVLIENAISMATDESIQPENVTPEKAVTPEELVTTTSVSAESVVMEELQKTVTTTMQTEVLVENAISQATEYQTENITFEEIISTESSTELITSAIENQETSQKEYSITEGNDQLLKTAILQATGSEFQDEEITPETTLEPDLEQTTGRFEGFTIFTLESEEPSEAPTEIPDVFSSAVEEAMTNQYLEENITAEELTTLVIESEEPKIASEAEVSHGIESTTKIPDELVENVEATETSYRAENFTPEKELTEEASTEEGTPINKAVTGIQSEIGHIFGQENIDTESPDELLVSAEKEATRGEYNAENITAEPITNLPIDEENSISMILSQGVSETEESSSGLTTEYSNELIETVLNLATFEPENITAERIFTEQTTEEQKTETSTETFRKVQSTTEADELVDNAVSLATEDKYQAANITAEEISSEETSTGFTIKEHTNENEEITHKTIVTEESDQLLKSAVGQATENEYQDENITPEEMTTLAVETNESPTKIQIESASEIEETSEKTTTEASDEFIVNAISQASQSQYELGNITPEEITKIEIDTEKETQLEVVTESSSVQEALGKAETTTEIQDELLKTAMSLVTDNQYNAENVTAEEHFTVESLTEEEPSAKITESLSDIEQIFSKTEFTPEAQDELIQSAMSAVTGNQYRPENFTAEEISTLEKNTEAEEAAKSEQEKSEETTEVTDEIAENALSEASREQLQPENLSLEETSSEETVITEDLEATPTLTPTEYEFTTEQPDEVISSALKVATESKNQLDNITAEEITLSEDQSTVTEQTEVEEIEITIVGPTTTEEPDEGIQPALQQATEAENLEKTIEEEAQTEETSTETVGTTETEVSESTESTVKQTLEEKIESGLEEATKYQQMEETIEEEEETTTKKTNNFEATEEETMQTEKTEATVTVEETSQPEDVQTALQMATEGKEIEDKVESAEITVLQTQMPEEKIEAKETTEFSEEHIGLVTETVAENIQTAIQQATEIEELEETMHGQEIYTTNEESEIESKTSATEAEMITESALTEPEADVKTALEQMTEVNKLENDLTSEPEAEVVNLFTEPPFASERTDGEEELTLPTEVSDEDAANALEEATSVVAEMEDNINEETTTQEVILGISEKTEEMTSVVFEAYTTSEQEEQEIETALKQATNAENLEERIQSGENTITETTIKAFISEASGIVEVNIATALEQATKFSEMEDMIKSGESTSSESGLFQNSITEHIHNLQTATTFSTGQEVEAKEEEQQTFEETEGNVPEIVFSEEFTPATRKHVFITDQPKKTTQTFIVETVTEYEELKPLTPQLPHRFPPTTAKTEENIQVSFGVDVGISEERVSEQQSSEEELQTEVSSIGFEIEAKEEKQKTFEETEGTVPEIVFSQVFTPATRKHVFITEQSEETTQASIVETVTEYEELQSLTPQVPQRIPPTKAKTEENIQVSFGVDVGISEERVSEQQSSEEITIPGVQIADHEVFTKTHFGKSKPTEDIHVSFGFEVSTSGQLEEGEAQTSGQAITPEEQIVEITVRPRSTSTHPVFTFIEDGANAIKEQKQSTGNENLFQTEETETAIPQIQMSEHEWFSKMRLGTTKSPENLEVPSGFEHSTSEELAEETQTSETQISEDKILAITLKPRSTSQQSFTPVGEGANHIEEEQQTVGKENLFEKEVFKFAKKPHTSSKHVEGYEHLTKVGVTKFKQLKETAEDVEEKTLVDELISEIGELIKESPTPFHHEQYRSTQKGVSNHEAFEELSEVNLGEGTMPQTVKAAYTKQQTKAHLFNGLEAGSNKFEEIGESTEAESFLEESPPSEVVAKYTRQHGRTTTEESKITENVENIIPEFTPFEAPKQKHFTTQKPLFTKQHLFNGLGSNIEYEEIGGSTAPETFLEESSPSEVVEKFTRQHGVTTAKESKITENVEDIIPEFTPFAAPTQQHKAKTHAFTGVKGGNFEELLTNGMEQISAEPFGKTTENAPPGHISEAYEENELPQFSTEGEGSTICKICDQSGKPTPQKHIIKTTAELSSNAQAIDHGTNTPRVHSDTSSQPLYSAISEDFEENDMEQFTEKGSTLCEICDTSGKKTPSHHTTPLKKHFPQVATSTTEKITTENRIKLITAIPTTSKEPETHTKEITESVTASAFLTKPTSSSGTEYTSKLPSPAAISISPGTIESTAKEEAMFGGTLKINTTELYALESITEPATTNRIEESSSATETGEVIYPITSSKVTEGMSRKGTELLASGNEEENEEYSEGSAETSSETQTEESGEVIYPFTSSRAGKKTSTSFKVSNAGTTGVTSTEGLPEKENEVVTSETGEENTEYSEASAETSSALKTEESEEIILPITSSKEKTVTEGLSEKETGILASGTEEEKEEYSEPSAVKTEESGEVTSSNEGKKTSTSLEVSGEGTKGATGTEGFKENEVAASETAEENTEYSETSSEMKIEEETKINEKNTHYQEGGITTTIGTESSEEVIEVIPTETEEESETENIEEILGFKTHPTTEHTSNTSRTLSEEITETTPTNLEINLTLEHSTIGEIEEESGFWTERTSLEQFNPEVTTQNESNVSEEVVRISTEPYKEAASTKSSTGEDFIVAKTSKASEESSNQATQGSTSKKDYTEFAIEETSGESNVVIYPEESTVFVPSTKQFNRTDLYTEFILNTTTLCESCKNATIAINKTELLQLRNVTEATTSTSILKTTSTSKETEAYETTGFEVVTINPSKVATQSILTGKEEYTIPVESQKSEEIEYFEEAVNVTTGLETTATTSTYDYEENESGSNFTRKNTSSLWKVGTTVVLLLSSVMANHTKVPHHNLSTSSTPPSIYVDLPIFLPNNTVKPGMETSHKEFLKFDWDNATESIILYVNGPNEEAIRRLNGSKWFRKLDNGELIYEPVKKHSTKAVPETTSEDVTAIPESNLKFPKFIKLDSCKSEDFENGDRCFCAIDSLVTSLKKGDYDENSTPSLHCLDYLKVDNGLIISDESVPEIRRKRSFMYGKQMVPFKREIIDYTKALFDVNYRIFDTDDKMYALPGSDVVIPCLNRNEVVEYNRYLQYSWLFENEVPVTNEKVEENAGNLALKDILTKNSGNYTCLVTSRLNQKNNVPQKYYHRLVIVSTPIYKIVTTLMYSLKQSCELSDGDLIASFLPKMLEGVLCGYQHSICKIEIRRPRCINRREEKLLNVTVIVTMSQLTEIYPQVMKKNCKINCQMALYSELAGILIKNVEIFEKLPVLSDMKPKPLEFKPKNVSQFQRKDNFWSSPPVVMIICPPGFGVERKTPRLCVVCPKNTYNKGYESYCKTCPAGQFQPDAGSPSCRICSSPLENRACLRVLYANTRYFKVYVGVAFFIVLALVASILYCLSRPANENRKSDTAFNASRRRGEEAPLLRPHRNVPPVPAPDF